MKNIIATMNTNKGIIKLELWPEIAPETVDNFVSLAKGEKEWEDPMTGQKTMNKFYDGLIFHRVIDDFMIQGGCPIGNGTGGPGFQFGDECYDEDGNLKAAVDYGTIAMANAGPGTNGSQFFIVTRKSGCDWLNGKHTVFGKVVEGLEIAHDIENVEKGPMDNPIEPVKINTVTFE